ncbi:MAG: Arc family DNA binding domain-containing protein [Planctomycetes bacterium]|nr:Arc family DNA binding domain-containing protein [Planctomycetota bacterium]
MAEKKPFLLRLPADLLADLNRWAKDELRSLNAQIEYVLRNAVRRERGRGNGPGEGARDAEEGP